MSSPRRSSSASSPRTVDAETSSPARSTSALEATGWPVATYSSTTRRRISPCRSSARCSTFALCISVRQAVLPSRRRPDAVRAASDAAWRRPPPRARGVASLASAASSIAGMTSSSRSGSSSRSPSMSRSRSRTSSLSCSASRAGGSPPPSAADVGREPRRVPPPQPSTVDTAPTPSAEVVASEPVREVVPRAEVATAVQLRRRGRSSPSRTSGSRPPSAA